MGEAALARRRSRSGATAWRLGTGATSAQPPSRSNVSGQQSQARQALVGASLTSHGAQIVNDCAVIGGKMVSVGDVVEAILR